MATTEIPDMGTDEEKPWHLSGNNAPVFNELTVTDLEVKGSIPQSCRVVISEMEQTLSQERLIIGSLEME